METIVNMLNLQGNFILRVFSKFKYAEVDVEIDIVRIQIFFFLGFLMLARIGPSHCLVS